MVEVKTKHTTQVTLVLNTSDTVWLKNILQNYAGEHPEDENEKDRSRRQDLFEKLVESLQGSRNQPPRKP